MPRASYYLLEGYTYHLTHRCQNREFLLRFARDRDCYREWLREGVKRFRVPVFGYSITKNHVHIVVHATDIDAVGKMMHLAAGSTAKQYNLRKDHVGSFWEHPYHCTLIQDGLHLFNCLRYIDLNMVRAGAVRHPSEWKWCGYRELLGERTRYRLLDLERLSQKLEVKNIADFREEYAEAVARRIEDAVLAREAAWTASLAVGSRDFVNQLKSRYGRRTKFDVGDFGEPGRESWSLRESRPFSYGPI